MPKTTLCCTCSSRPRRAEPECLCSCHGALASCERFAGKVAGAKNHGSIVALHVERADETRAFYCDHRMFQHFASSVDGQLVGLAVEVEVGEFNFVERVTVACEDVEGVQR